MSIDQGKYMPTNILFSNSPENWTRWQPHLERCLSARGVDAVLATNFDDPADVDFVVYAPTGGVDDFTPFTNLRAILSTWAGVEKIVTNESIKVPLARMVDPGLTAGMVEYCVGHALRYHLNLDPHIQRSDAKWQPELLPTIAANRTVGVLGIGALGEAVAKALVALNFNVEGWSRTPKAIEGVTCRHGDDGLAEVLRRSEILIVLLPLTDHTRGVLNADRLGLLPKGARLINPGRGPLIVDEALIAALSTGALDHATLDVFHVEPLPEDHPFWAHPKVTVTPHIAADTRPETAADMIAQNVARNLAGQEMLNIVNRSAGY